VDMTIKSGTVIYRQGEVVETAPKEKAADAR
jgi:hypothetical protein